MRNTVYSQIFEAHNFAVFADWLRTAKITLRQIFSILAESRTPWSGVATERVWLRQTRAWTRSAMLEPSAPSNSGFIYAAQVPLSFFFLF